VVLIHEKWIEALLSITNSCCLLSVYSMVVVLCSAPVCVCAGINVIHHYPRSMGMANNTNHNFMYANSRLISASWV